MALLVCHLVFTFAAGTDPHSFFNNTFSVYTLQIVPALLQIVPGLKRVQNRSQWINRPTGLLPCIYIYILYIYMYELIYIYDVYMITHMCTYIIHSDPYMIVRMHKYKSYIYIYICLSS